MDALGLPGLTCAYAIADFESNIKTSFLEVWPGIAFRHCLFHYKQAIWRKVSTSGMASVFRNAQNILFRSLIKSVMCLPFVPLARMPEAVQIIASIGEEMTKLSHAKFFKKFTAYLNNQWFRNMDQDWLRTWNIYSKTGSHTNNVSEAYNRVFANCTFFINAHPPIFLWVKVVKQELLNAVTSVGLSEAGNPEKSDYYNDKQTEHRQKMRSNLMVQLGLHTLSLKDYLISMGNTYLIEDDPVLQDIDHETELNEKKKKDRRQSHQKVARK